MTRKSWQFSLHIPYESSGGNNSSITTGNVKAYGNPYGYSAKNAVVIPHDRTSGSQESQRHQAIAASAWSVVLQPAKSVVMSFVMVFFLKGEGIFATLLLIYALSNTLQAMFNMFKVFKPFDAAETGDMFLLQKSAYAAVCLGVIGYELHLCASNGIIPINSGDFVRLVPVTQIAEFATGKVT